MGKEERGALLMWGGISTVVLIAAWMLTESLYVIVIGPILAIAVTGMAMQSAKAHAAAVAAAQVATAERWNRLVATFGHDVAIRILKGEIWQGQTFEELYEAIGAPIESEEKVLKTKVKRTLKYEQRSARAFGLRVFTEDGVVVGWERK